MIDEIEADSQHLLKRYKELFGKIGIEHIYEEKLGFGENCIGYLPLEEAEINAIQQQSKVALQNVFDSFNLTIDPSAYYYISYLNSDIKITASQVFVANTLCELQGKPSSINYIFSLGVGDWDRNVARISEGVYDFLSDCKTKQENRDIADKFSKLSTVLVDVHKNKVIHKELQNWEGNKNTPINIIFMNSGRMPKNIWHNFIAIAKSGIMTGDQSLCDYLSIKKELPFYEMRNWKWPLRESLINSAEKFGNKELKEYVKTRIFGRMPPYGDISYKFMQSSMLNDKLHKDLQNFGAFLSQKNANDAIKKIVKKEAV